MYRFRPVRRADRLLLRGWLRTPEVARWCSVGADEFESVWFTPPVPQYYTGTCWAFCSVSFLETEAKRLYDVEVKLSEMWVVYWEYVEKCQGYLDTFGKSVLAQGGQEQQGLGRSGCLQLAHDLHQPVETNGKADARCGRPAQFLHQPVIAAAATDRTEADELAILIARFEGQFGFEDGAGVVFEATDNRWINQDLAIAKTGRF